MWVSENLSDIDGLLKDYIFELLMFLLLLMVAIKALNPIFFLVCVVIYYFAIHYYRLYQKLSVFKSVFEESFPSVRSSIESLAESCSEEFIEKLTARLTYFLNTKPERTSYDYYTDYFDFCVVVYILKKGDTLARILNSTTPLEQRYKIALSAYEEQLEKWSSNPFRDPKSKPEFIFDGLTDYGAGVETEALYELRTIFSRSCSIFPYRNLKKILPANHILHPVHWGGKQYTPEYNYKLKALSRYYTPRVVKYFK